MQDQINLLSSNKQVEKGILNVKIKQCYTMIFEKYPLFLLALHPSEVKLICIPHFHNWDHLLTHYNSLPNGDLFKALSQKFGMNKCIFGSVREESSYTLLTGLIQFCTAYIGTLSQNMVYVALVDQ